MKIKFNHNLFIYFINNNMAFNIDEEHKKLIQVIDDNTFDFLKFAQSSLISYNSVQINFLFQVLKLTIKYPHVESYLKNLLNHFTVNELEDVFGSCSILHYMCVEAYVVSLHAFEIIINYGISVNIENIQGNTAAHILLRNQCTNHIHNILNILIKHDTDLNIISTFDFTNTVLDELICFQRQLNEETKNCITTLIDFGGITNSNRKRSTIMHDFVENYMCSTIKPAIKK